jgi:hypothetical protein
VCRERLEAEEIGMNLRQLIGTGVLRSAIAGTALISASALGGCMITSDSWSSNVERKTVSLDIEHVSGSAIDIESENGSVTVRASDDAQSVSVNAEIRAKTVERLEATKIVASRNSEGALVLRVEWPENKREGSEGVSFDVTLPDARGVTINTGNGRIELENLSGEAKLETSNGRIMVGDHDGPVFANTSNGRIEVDDIDGPVRVRTSNGRVIANDVNGVVDIVTSNGSIQIELEDGVQGPSSAKTSNGSITLSIGGSLKGTLDLSTSNDQILVKRAGQTSTFKGKAQVVLNGGGPTTTLSTSNGRITVEVDSDD